MYPRHYEVSFLFVCFFFIIRFRWRRVYRNGRPFGTTGAPESIIRRYYTNKQNARVFTPKEGLLKTYHDGGGLMEANGGSDRRPLRSYYTRTPAADRPITPISSNARALGPSYKCRDNERRNPPCFPRNITTTVNSTNTHYPKGRRYFVRLRAIE